MKDSEIVCSLDLSAQLSKLGLNLDAYFSWINHPYYGWTIYRTHVFKACSFNKRESYPAYTADELLPEIWKTAGTISILYKAENNLLCTYIGGLEETIMERTLADMLASTIIAQHNEGVE